ncbi:hypothetical protein ZWY2020_030748 [Hordeum vulgare]|nr:hypothetical protein ZWY2020_030748 [Hordeum vulgare]
MDADTESQAFPNRALQAAIDGGRPWLSPLVAHQGGEQCQSVIDTSSRKMVYGRKFEADSAAVFIREAAMWTNNTPSSTMEAGLRAGGDLVVLDRWWWRAFTKLAHLLKKSIESMAISG